MPCEGAGTRSLTVADRRAGAGSPTPPYKGRSRFRNFRALISTFQRFAAPFPCGPNLNPFSVAPADRQINRCNHACRQPNGRVSPMTSFQRQVKHGVLLAVKKLSVFQKPRTGPVRGILPPCRAAPSYLFARSTTYKRDSVGDGGLHAPRATHSAIARLAVRPGNSTPNRLTRPATPWSFSVWMRKSVPDPPGRAIFGRMPA